MKTQPLKKSILNKLLLSLIREVPVINQFLLTETGNTVFCIFILSGENYELPIAANTDFYPTNTVFRSTFKHF